MREDPTDELLKQLLRAHDDISHQAHRESSTGLQERRSRWAGRKTRIGADRGLRSVGRGWLALGTAVLCAAIATAAVYTLKGTVSPAEALAAQMDRLALTAAHESRIGIPKAGKYLYTESYELADIPETSAGNRCVVQVLLRRQIWAATDGAGALREVSRRGRFTSARDAARCRAMGVSDPARSDTTAANTYPAGKHGLPFITNNWSAYSTNPKTLLRQVHEHDGGPNTSNELLTNVVDFLREADAPPKIRAALYRATALIPGVRLLGARTDPKGQKGVAVAVHPKNQPEYIVIFDRRNSRLLAEEYVSHGRLMTWNSYTKQTIVNSHPNFPPVR